MNTSKPFLATAVLSNGTHRLSIAALVVANDLRQAHKIAERRLPADSGAVRAMMTPVPHVAERTLVQLPEETFDVMLLSAALPVLTLSGEPYVREAQVHKAAKWFKDNQLASAPSLPGGDDLPLVLRSHLNYTGQQLTSDEFAATLALLALNEEPSA